MGDFLQNFQRSMDRLEGLNDRIRTGLQNKSDFSANLLARLRQINEQIRGLADKITRLKQRLDALQLQVDGNSGSITDKDTQIQQLTQQVRELEDQRNQLQTQLRDIQLKSGEDLAVMQSRIDDFEARIRSITDENKALTEHVRALDAELAGRGDIQTQHAAELKSQADAFAAQAQETMRQNEEEKARLRDEIRANVERLQEREQELQRAQAAIAENNARIDQSQAELREQIRVLTEQVATLTGQNADLTGRIEAATVAINQASDNLEQLINAFPNAQSTEEFRALFDEITQSIQELDHLIEGNGMPLQPPPPPPGMPPGSPPVSPPVSPAAPARRRPQPALDPNTIISVPVAGGANIEVRYSKVIVDLNNKRSIKKYADAIPQVRAATTPDEVAQALRANGIYYQPSGNMKGGRKTKKLRKQKGGFVYKVNTKRRSLSSNSKRRSRSSSRKSNKSSF
jgi:predicted  nucleic acid-binding Zn-ribbon protein